MNETVYKVKQSKDQFCASMCNHVVKKEQEGKNLSHIIRISSRLQWKSIFNLRKGLPEM